MSQSTTPSPTDNSHNQGIIAWFARNSVAANLLMMFIFAIGALSYFGIKKQMFPQIELNLLEISVFYPGAAPQEVNEGITLKVEEALGGIEGFKQVTTYSFRGHSYTRIELEDEYDPEEVLDEVKAEIDSVNTFPDRIERPIVRRIKFRQEVAYVSLYGDIDNHRLKALGKDIYDELRALPSINVSDYYSGLPYEIGIEIDKNTLREYNLTLANVANAVRQFSTNQSAGQIRAENGYISLRVEEQAYTGEEFEQIPLINREDGTQILLGDVANVIDGFQEGIQYSRFNGMNSVTLFVGASSDQSITDISDVLNTFVEAKQASLPQGIGLETWVDMTYYLEGRLNMMIKNMVYGGLLVFLVLALFLRLKVAFWVMLGLPVAFFGTLIFLPMNWIGVTINVASLFGFILVLGIVVDDAIVIGESAYTEIEKRGQSLNSVVRGAQRVAMPATFGVLTTIAAFLPMLFSSGPESAFSQSIGFVVIFCLIFSLIESKLILPSHLANMKLKEENPRSPLYKIRSRIDGSLKHIIEHFYRPALATCVHYRYAVIATFLSIVLISIGLVSGGFLRFINTPPIPHDFVTVEFEMHENSAESATLDTMLQINRIINDVELEIEEQYQQVMISDVQTDLRSRTSGNIMTKLVDPDNRPLGTFELTDIWRERLPEFPGLKSLTIYDSVIRSGNEDGDINFKLISDNTEQLNAATEALRKKLSGIVGVGDINDSRQATSEEIQLELKPLAYSMGLTLSDVASQVSYSFYGLEAQRILRNGDEIKVMVRYPENERKAIDQVGDTLIRTPQGNEVPLSEVASTSIRTSENQIRREDGYRSVRTWASVDVNQAEPIKIAEDIQDNFLPDLLAQYPSVKSELAGQIQEEQKALVESIRNFAISMIIIYGLLAIPLRSYAQPIIIMSVIPFGIIGAMLGHLILGRDMSSLSFFGVIAAAGVVVNDSLVMVDFINKARIRGLDTVRAVIEAGTHRFRAIILTSLTTFIGLIPIISETSLQAQFVIPMAVSLAFGVLFATVITLIFIPCLYVVGTDIKSGLRRVFQEKTKMPLSSDGS